MRHAGVSEQTHLLYGVTYGLCYNVVALRLLHNALGRLLEGTRTRACGPHPCAYAPV